MEAKGTKRVPVVNGLFYPDKPDELNSIVEKYVNDVNREEMFKLIKKQTNLDPRITAPIVLIAPHAGYMFSGRVQAFSYTLISGMQFDTVVVMGTAHQKEFDGISVNTDSEYEIPTGSIKVDMDFVEELLKYDEISTVEEAHLQEHSVEVQLPFIKYVLPDARIVPVLFGKQYLSTAEKLYSALVAAVKKLPKNYIFVVSSDLSHYHNYIEAKTLDETLIDHLKSMNEREFYECIKAKKCEACCYGGIITAMLLAKDFGIGKSVVLKYMDSGVATGDRRRVVGYLSAAMY